jgi:ABC-type Fe3+/spermidine/putrescine transport system ATPase subunit
VSTAPAPLLAVDLEVERRQVTVRAGFSLEAGERLAIFGTSGAGKTTILESIAGLTRLSRGKVRVDGKLVAGKLRGEAAMEPRHRQVALVRQPTTLFPHLTVEQNVAYGIRHSPGRTRVAELLERLGLSALSRARGAALSGGQRQRVALGRALASPFRVLLLDEPLSAVDVAAREALRTLTIETSLEHEAAGILVTHDLAEAQAFSDQLGIIDNGHLLQLGGSLEVVRSPLNRRVAELVGYGGFVPVPTKPDRRYAIHPDRVVPGAMAERGVVLSGKIVSTRPFGPRYECTVAEPSGEQFTIHLDEPPHLDEPCTVTVLDPPVVEA